MSDGPFHIFTRPGNGFDDVNAVLGEMKKRGLTPEAAGFNKYLIVTQADQTVVFLTGRDVPFAAALRRRPGWLEPGDKPL
ncbi:MAG TPA: hypothetical protein VFE05_11000 [Longimicrobiaceae bacterium]|jgi:hypothetical protein|nr:hypothetical protein [Longimicrobiaceae bacterium]